MVTGLALALVIVPSAMILKGAFQMEEDPIQRVMPLVKEYEGLSLKPYWDANGYPTIGYGHKLSDQQKAPLSTWEPITKAQAETLLLEDLALAQKELRALVKVDLTAGQEAALIDFVYNLGSGRLEDSTLLHVLNGGDYNSVPNQLVKWVHAGGRVEEDLVRRRADEIRLWRTGD